jgi:hypothetical protein
MNELSLTEKKKDPPANESTANHTRFLHFALCWPTIYCKLWLDASSKRFSFRFIAVQFAAPRTLITAQANPN